MKIYRLYLLTTVIAAMVLGAGCKKIDSYNSPASGDLSKPGIVTDVKVVNFDGGANITYKLPSSANILYVKASYKINDQKSRETQASYYSDSLKVDGFAQSKDYDVTLRVVSRANIESDPVVIKVHPGAPIYEQVFPSVKMEPDFGGANIKALNPSEKPIGIIVVNLTTSTPRLLRQFFTSRDTIEFNIRGLNTDPRKIGVYVTDQWGNRSDTLLKDIVPIFESEINKSKFAAYPLSTDSRIFRDWGLPYLWDNVIDGSVPPMHTDVGAGIPGIVTFDMGQTAKLSRFKAWQQEEFAYTDGNPKRFVLWGATTPGQDVNLPVNSSLGDVVGGWIQIGTYNSPPPPSGNVPPTPATDADKAFVRQGFDFNVPFSAPAVRYIRIQAIELWNPSINFFIFQEMTFYGKTE
jgi:hypothetical protein